MSNQQQKLSFIPSGMCQHCEQLLMTHMERPVGQARLHDEAPPSLETLRRLASNSGQPGKSAVGPKRKRLVQPEKEPVVKKSRRSPADKPNKKKTPRKSHPVFKLKKLFFMPSWSHTPTKMTCSVKENRAPAKSTQSPLDKPPRAKGPPAAERKGTNADQVRPRSSPENPRQIILLDEVQNLKGPRVVKRGPKSVEQKTEFKSTPVNFAKRKIEMFSKLSLARSCGESQRANLIQAELTKIDKMARAFEEQRRTQSVSRNIKSPIVTKATRKESSPPLADEFRGLEPYARKKTVPIKICGLKDPHARRAIFNELDQRYACVMTERPFTATLEPSSHTPAPPLPSPHSRFRRIM